MSLRKPTTVCPSLNMHPDCDSVYMYIHYGIFFLQLHCCYVYPVEMTSNGDLVRDIEMSTNGSVERSTMDASSVEGQPVHSNSTNSAHQPGESATNKELKVPTYLKVLAAIIATFFMIAVFVCAVLSKTSFMAIASRMYLGNSTMHCDDHELVRRQSVAFVQLMIVLCVPQAFTALRTLFFGVLKARDTFPWPSLMAFMLVSGN